MTAVISVDGIRDIDLPASPQRVWAALKEARS
jgi:hypothetical protein